MKVWHGAVAFNLFQRRAAPAIGCLLAGVWAAGLASTCAAAAEPQGAVEAAAAGAPAGAAAAAGPVASAAAARHHAHRHLAGSGIDERVSLLARELSLDTTQRAAVRKALELQRAAVEQVWRDASVPAAVRIKAMEVIGERTADQIRALLNDEQRRKYILPRRPPEDPAAPRPDVAKWMDAIAAPGPVPKGSH